MKMVIFFFFIVVFVLLLCEENLLVGFRLFYKYLKGKFDIMCFELCIIFLVSILFCVGLYNF